MTKQKTWSEEVVLAELKRYVEHFGSTQGLSKNCKGLYQKIKAHGDNGTEFYRVCQLKCVI